MSNVEPDNRRRVDEAGGESKAYKESIKHEGKEIKDSKENKEKEAEAFSTWGHQTAADHFIPGSARAMGREVPRGSGAPGQGTDVWEMIDGLARRIDALEHELTIIRLTQRVQELERQMAIGRSFIRPEERPDVGRAVLEDEETDGATEDARGDD